MTDKNDDLNEVENDNYLPRLLDVQLSQLYHECADHTHYTLSNDAAQAWDAIVERIAQELYDGTLKPSDLDGPTVKRIAKELMKAIFEGSGVSFDTEGITDQQYSMLAQMEKNIYYFSSFKNYQQLKEANAMLLDENKKVRPFSEFKKLVKEINAKYNVQWLNAEYGNALASSQMASKWQQIQQEKESLPFLKYDTVGDDRVREAHRELDGVIRRVDDAFWKTYYPPNGWNCRCSIRQEFDVQETPTSEIVYPDIPKMFHNNVGISNQVFPKSHPYIFDTTGKDKAIVTKNAKELTPKRNAT